MRKAVPIVCFFIFLFSIAAVGQVQVIKETKEGGKICDLILALNVVRYADNYVRKVTHGKRHLFAYISDSPTRKENFYWVKVAEDNGMSYVTHFTFRVDSKTYDIRYLDDDKLIPLKLCSKRLMDEYRIHK
jgi:hypothetical protein